MTTALNQIIQGGEEALWGATLNNFGNVPGGGVALRSVAAVRHGALGGQTTPNRSNGIVTGQTFRQWTPMVRTVSGLVVSFANWSLTAAGEIDGPNAITVKAAIEYNGATYPLNFGGQRTATLAPGAEVDSDPLTVAIPAGADVWTRVYVTANGVASGTYPLGRSADSLNANRDSSGSNGVDSADATGVLSVSAHFAYGPLRIVGLDRVDGAIGLLGDSITAGTGTTTDVLTADSMMGFQERAIARGRPWVTVSRSSYRYSYLTQRALQTFRNGAVSDVIDAMGRNDLASGDSLATIQASALATWTSLKSLGVSRVYKTTITPIGTTSTDNFITVANQTLAFVDPEAQRVLFNAWLRAGAPIVGGVAVATGTPGALLMAQAGHPLTGIIEASDAVESARDSGKWGISPFARTVTGASMGAGSRTVFAAALTFTDDDIGLTTQIPGAGVAGATLNTKFTRKNTGGASAVVLSAATTAISAASIALGGIVDDGIHPSDAGARFMGVPIKVLFGL